MLDHIKVAERLYEDVTGEQWMNALPARKAVWTNAVEAALKEVDEAIRATYNKFEEGMQMLDKLC